MIVPEAATIDLVAVTTTDPVPRCRIWTAKPRIDSVADKRANASRTSNAAALIASAAVDLAAVALVAGEASGADDENYAWNSPIFFLKLKP